MKYFIYLSLVMMFFSCNQAKEEKEQLQNKQVEAKQEIASPRLVIHGGAGYITKDQLTPEEEKAYHDKLEEALKKGYELLQNGTSSTETVVQVIQILEESPLFNAGRGAVFTSEGKNELDASIMDGATQQSGAVAGVVHIKSPIEAAYYVMTASPHVMMAGAGAEKFALLEGLEMVGDQYFYTDKNYERLLEVQQNEKNKDSTKTALLHGTEDYKYGTVGVVALDQNGNLAAGTSTGGMTNKKFGRIGDSPIIGAGTYASNDACAVSATGHGEFFIRNVVAYDIAARVKYQNKDLKTAAQEVIDELKEKGGAGGVICLDRYGNIAMPFNTPGMFRGSVIEGKIEIEMYGDN